MMKNGSTMHFKQAKIAGLSLSDDDMMKINSYALSPLSADEVFAFKITMAANEIDRDFEVFPTATLAKLANLFIGKTVVKDHVHKSDNQIARIYATQLEEDPLTLTKTGEVYTRLVARCYTVKTASNADLISEISAGIRKEVSIGCRVGRAVCSVCGTDNVKTYCQHFAGRSYDGETCYYSLENPQDAYEVSFVAIPAQKEAGTTKNYHGDVYEEEQAKAQMQASLDEQEAQKAASLEELITKRVKEQIEALMQRKAAYIAESGQEEQESPLENVEVAAEAAMDAAVPTDGEASDASTATQGAEVEAASVREAADEAAITDGAAQVEEQASTSGVQAETNNEEEVSEEAQQPETDAQEAAQEETTSSETQEVSTEEVVSDAPQEASIDDAREKRMQEAAIRLRMLDASIATKKK